MYDELQLKAYSTELDQTIKKHELRYIRLYDFAFERQGVAAEEVIDRLRATESSAHQ